MATTQDFANWVPGSDLLSDYLYWTFQAMAPEFERLRVGSTHKTIYMPDIKRLQIVTPPVAAQRAIADFLDKKTAAIDALIAKKERLIELLQEKRQALITQAVTKGLDPNVPMKDSGVEWLGEIPAHWEVQRVKNLVDWVEQGWSPQCDGEPAEPGQWGVLKAGCVNGGFFREDENKQLPLGLEPRPQFQVFAGDVLICRASGSPDLIGSVAQVSRAPAAKLLLSDKVFRCRNIRCFAPYLVYALSARPSRAQIEISTSGADGLANNLPKSALVNFWIGVPPIDEQRSIAMHLQRSLSSLDSISYRLTMATGALREYRQALITEAVTGKLDIPAEPA